MTKQSIRWFLLPWIASLTLVMTIEAYAEPSTYAPEFCNFEITFPEAPYKTQRCDGENKNQCYEQVSFTKVFGELSSTVNFRVICNPVGEAIKETYSGEVMRTTLRAMTERSTVQTFKTSYREEEHYKQAGLVGEGKSGRTDTIYIAQLWIGDSSAFTVEAELIGEPSDAADELFSDILRSARYSEVEEPESKEETPTKTTPE